MNYIQFAPNPKNTAAQLIYDNTCIEIPIDFLKDLKSFLSDIKSLPPIKRSTFRKFNTHISSILENMGEPKDSSDSLESIYAMSKDLIEHVYSVLVVYTIQLKKESTEPITINQPISIISKTPEEALEKLSNLNSLEKNDRFKTIYETSNFEQSEFTTIPELLKEYTDKSTSVFDFLRHMVVKDITIDLSTEPDLIESNNIF